MQEAVYPRSVAESRVRETGKSLNDLAKSLSCEIPSSVCVYEIRAGQFVFSTAFYDCDPCGPPFMAKHIPGASVELCVPPDEE